MAGAAVTVIAGDGRRAGSTTTDASGKYTLSVPGNATYLVKVTSGNIVMRAVRTVGTADATINVNPGTTVTVAVLENAMNTVLDDGTTFGNALSGVDVNNTVTQITTLPSYTTAANAAVTAVAANTDPSTAASAVTTTSSTVTHVTVPAAPTGVSATAGNGQVTVSWTAVAGADSYSIYYRASAGVTVANGTKAMSASAGSTITGLTNGTAYYFIITAVNAGGESVASSQVSATPLVPATTPSAPTGLTATAGNAQVTVSWTAATGATSYNVYYRASAGVTIANGTKLTGATSGSTITGLANGTTYYFIVTAVNTGGESAISAEVSATPAAAAQIIANLMGGAIQKALTISTGAVTTFAGSAGVAGSTDATGTAARLKNPTGITTDGTNLYWTEQNNWTIRKMVIASGVVTTLAGSVGVAGSTDGTGTAALFYGPHGITTDGTNLYVADVGNSTIRKVVIATGVVTTLAGSAGVTGSTDGIGTAARFYWPWGITTDGTNLYVADTHNSTVRKVVIATGAVTTLAGIALSQGTTDGTGTAARFWGVEGITTDGTNLYVLDNANNTIRKIVIATGTVTTLAGSAGMQGSTDGTGTATLFYWPIDITTDGTNLYVVGYNNTVRKVVIATGVVTTIAGTSVAGSADGTGTAAGFSVPYGITTDGVNLYVGDSGNNTIRKIGSAGTGTGTAPSAPTGVTATAGNAQVTVSWTAVTGATSYNVYYRTSAGITIANGTKLTGVTTGSTITGLTNGTPYYFVVTAVNAGGESAVSNEVNATPQAPAAGVPTGVTATAGNAQVTVSWTAVAGATSYNVYYRTSAGVTIANGTKLTGATSGAAITSLTNNITYFFVVTAVNAGGESAVSNEASATPISISTIATHSTLPTAIASYWKLDGNSNDSVGTNNGADTAVIYSTGARNQAASINGATSEISVGNLGTINDYSVSMWFKKGVASGYPSGGVFEADMFGTQNDITMYQYFKFGWHTSWVDQPFIIMSTTSSDGRGFTAPAITDTSWHHIVVVRTGSTLNAYIDGTAVTLTSRFSSGAPTATISTGNPTKLGTVGGTTDAHFNGTIDEVGVWNRVLTSTEVSNLYNGGAGLPYQ